MMKTFHELAVEDLEWILPTLGQDIHFFSQQLKKTLSFKAIVDRSAENPPAYGYENVLTEKHHEVTFLRSSLGAGVTPIRGDKVSFDGHEYEVHYVRPDDADVWTVAAR